jgi:hypothetical protein
VNVIWFFKQNEISQGDFFNTAVSNSYQESYDGVVLEKYYDKYNHGKDVIVIENNGIKTKLDLSYEKKELYDFINIEDTLTKKINTNSLRIKRKNLDTIIALKFENIKGFEKQNYKPELTKTDSIPQGKMMYELYFAEFGGRMGNLRVEIQITGNKIIVYNNEINPLTGGKIIIEGILLKHKSGKWIIGETETDQNTEEIGGCSGGPTPIDFETKIIEWC